MIMIVPVILLGNSLEADTLEVEACLALITDEDGLSVVLPAALGAAALLALLLLVVQTDLALGRVLPFHGRVHLLLQLLGPVGRLDGDLQPHGLVGEGELAVGDWSEVRANDFSPHPITNNKY